MQEKALKIRSTTSEIQRKSEVTTSEIQRINEEFPSCLTSSYTVCWILLLSYTQPNNLFGGTKRKDWIAYHYADYIVPLNMA